MKTKIGLYGTNGHQIQNRLMNHPDAELVAVAAFKPVPGVRQYETLDELLADPEVELVSLCSPRRADQAADAIRCFRAGKHVYAEKPFGLTECELDSVLAVARETGLRFHEMMSCSVLEQPYREMRRLIQSGTIGTVVQVFGQKCYPWADWRPHDEAIDGGLSTQVGVYLARFVEHVACQKIASMEIAETKLGNPVPGSECRMAISASFRLENGGLATGICNYLNPIKERCWGYEILRAFGTEGILESNADGAQARLLRNGQPVQPLDLSEPTQDWFDIYIRSLRDGTPMPLSLEEELSPTRWAVRAKEAANAVPQGGRPLPLD